MIDDVMEIVEILSSCGVCMNKAGGPTEVIFPKADFKPGMKVPLQHATYPARLIVQQVSIKTPSYAAVHKALKFMDEHTPIVAFKFCEHCDDWLMMDRRGPNDSICGWDWEDSDHCSDDFL